jgi:hypothetical protein
MGPNGRKIRVVVADDSRTALRAVCAYLYFQWETKIKVVDSLGKYLTSGGYLFLGHAESLHGVADKLQFVAPKVFPSSRDPLARAGALCILQRRDHAVRG